MPFFEARLIWTRPRKEHAGQSSYLHELYWIGTLDHSLKDSQGFSRIRRFYLKFCPMFLSKYQPRSEFCLVNLEPNSEVPATQVEAYRQILQVRDCT